MLKPGTRLFFQKKNPFSTRNFHLNLIRVIGSVLEQIHAILWLIYHKMIPIYMLKLIYRVFLWETYCADNGRTNITQHRENVSTCLAVTRSGLWHVITMQFVRSFLKCHLAGKPVVHGVAKCRLFFFRKRLTPGWVVLPYENDPSKLTGKEGRNPYTGRTLCA